MNAYISQYGMTAAHLCQHSFCNW